jgi:ATP synthase protein I
VKPDPKAWGALGSVGSLGFIMAAGILMGWWAGTWLDRRWGTEPWGLLGCLLLGVVGAVLECWRILKRYIASESRKGPRERP